MATMEDSFWEGVEHASTKSDLLEEVEWRADTIGTPKKSYTNWVDSLDIPPWKQPLSAEEYQMVPSLPVPKPNRYLPEKEDATQAYHRDDTYPYRVTCRRSAAHHRLHNRIRAEHIPHTIPIETGLLRN